MKNSIYLPIDQLVDGAIDYDQATDGIELSAFFNEDSVVLISDLVNQTSIGTEEGTTELDREMKHGEEEIISGTVAQIKERRARLDSVYPFELDFDRNLLECKLSKNYGQIAYIVSLILSNIHSLSPILSGSDLHPDEQDIRRLREFFQYFATTALAAEIQGRAWSFGFPRPDGSGFLAKLEQIWQILDDGRVQRQIGAPKYPKDDRIDVFAARLHPDGLPGFLLAAAQVATGKNITEKSIKGHLDAFKSRWFNIQPVTDFIPYMIVPFSRPYGQFVDDVRTMGNMLHRLRIPLRVEEAAQLIEQDSVQIEGYDQLIEATEWIMDYRKRTRISTPL